MDCPKCQNHKSVKDGIVKGKQRYKCKSCNYRYTVELKSTAKPKNTKRQALELYLEGLGFRSIGRFFRRKPRICVSMDKVLRGKY